jgi:hypothetical protein
MSGTAFVCLAFAFDGAFILLAEVLRLIDSYEEDKE